MATLFTAVNRLLFAHSASLAMRRSFSCSLAWRIVGVTVVLSHAVHSLQDNVLAKYRENMNNRRVSQYNTLMARLCRQSSPSIPFFDTFSITAQSDSFDGVHYGFKVNLLKAQLLLSMIKEGFD